MVQTTVPPKAPAAVPPRQPSLADIRKIRQALDEAYDDEAGCYRGNASDRSLSERLDVPRAWVSNEREHAYGPERCEQDREDLAKVEGIKQRAADLEAQAMEVAQAAETLRRDAEAMRARLAARGVQ
ncbi:hypothetical protein [Caulobacter segnis]|uniref:Uncharacterized protein n=1 Tax=Caulobacter segnis TaxID=88688 RepID=A0A2W5X6H5_9CAUL|nr:hypothetical protein [Caulobacter segnis]PZR36474.1 MAG: hypothetical protein DI526_03285 [Caulobacter segnis]